MRLFKRLTAGGKKSGLNLTNSSTWNGGNMFSPKWMTTGGLGGDREWLETNFEQYVQKIYKDNGVAYACIQTRAMVFSEARFQFQRMRQGMPASGPRLAEGDSKPAPSGEQVRTMVQYGGNTPSGGGSSSSSSSSKPKAANDTTSGQSSSQGSQKPSKPQLGKKPGSKKPQTAKGSTNSAQSLFGTEALKILDQPWPGGTTGQLLFQMEVDASICGNSYWTHADDEGNYGKAARGKDTTRLVRLRPDYVQIIIHSTSGNPWAIDSKVGGYLYKPYTSAGYTGTNPGPDEQILLMADEVAHYAPVQDPEAHFRGMTWIRPVLRELGSDVSAMKHKKNFFDGGATLGHIISLSEEVGQEDFEYFVEKFKEEHEGVDNAYKTLVLGGGADVSTVGVDLKQLDFTQTQGHGETRIAAASGVPPVIVGLSEGLQAATYSNYSQARRRFADGTLRPLWRMACGALATIIDVPADARLWYDDRDISFLRDDQLDEANISEIDARAMKALVEGGWEPDAIAEYIVTRDPSVLIGEHSGLMSVQLLPPGTPQPFVGPGGLPGTGGGGGQGGASGGRPSAAGSGAQGRPSSASSSKPSSGAKPSQSKPSGPRKPSGGRKHYVRD